MFNLLLVCTAIVSVLLLILNFVVLGWEHPQWRVICEAISCGSEEFGEYCKEVCN